MKGFAKFGAIIVMLICFAIPVLTTLSFCFWWHLLLRFFLSLFSLSEVILVVAATIEYVEEHYDD